MTVATLVTVASMMHSSLHHLANAIVNVGRNTYYKACDLAAFTAAVELDMAHNNTTLEYAFKPEVQFIGAAARVQQQQQGWDEVHPKPKRDDNHSNGYNDKIARGNRWRNKKGKWHNPCHNCDGGHHFGYTCTAPCHARVNTANSDPGPRDAMDAIDARDELPKN